VLDPTAWSAAGIYAQAALGLMDDAHAEDFLDELRALVDIFDQYGELNQLLGAPLLSSREKVALISRALSGNVSRQLEGLVVTMARHDRLNLLRPAANQMRRLLDLREGKIEVTVTTVDAMDSDQRQALVASLSQALHRDVILKEQLDEDLLGGAVVRVGDKVFDASIRAEIDKLQRDLLSRRGTLK